jgi:hypothetical protein
VLIRRQDCIDTGGDDVDRNRLRGYYRPDGIVLYRQIKIFFTAAFFALIATEE